VHIEKIVHNFSRYHKYTLGSELRNGEPRHPRRGAGLMPPIPARARARG
jgi:hypothetical protein